jgi:prophage regulatory protein
MHEAALHPASISTTSKPSRTAEKKPELREVRDRIVRQRELRERIPVDDSTIWRWEQAGKFPRRIRLGPNSIGWRESEIAQWLDDRQRG